MWMVNKLTVAEMISEVWVWEAFSTPYSITDSVDQ